MNKECTVSENNVQITKQKKIRSWEKKQILYINKLF